MPLLLYRRTAKLIAFWLLLAWLLAACAAENPPTASAPAATRTAQASPTIEPKPTLETAAPAVPLPTDDPDAPVTTLPPPAVTVGVVPTVANIPSPTVGHTANYDGLPTPPPTLPVFTPAALPDKTLPKNHFVVATRTGLYLINANGGESRALVANAGFSQPKIAPDGTQIAVFRTDPISRQTVAYLVPLQGTARLIPTEAGSRIFEMAWSPDSKSLALTKATDTNGDGAVDYQDATSIWLYDIAANKSRKLIEGSTPVWSPDGSRLLFTSGEATMSEIDPLTQKARRVSNSLVVYNLQNNSKRVLLAAKDVQLNLPPEINPAFSGAANLRYFKAVSWSPDNRALAVSADGLLKNGNKPFGLVLTLTLDDVTPRIVTASGDAAARLVWSGDGKRLAFETEPQFPVTTKSNFAVGVAAFDNPAKAPLALLGHAGLQGEARRPRWLDNTSLAYLEGVEGNAVLTVANSDGSNLRRLLSGCSGFDWS